MILLILLISCSSRVIRIQDWFISGMLYRCGPNQHMFLYRLQVPAMGLTPLACVMALHQSWLYEHRNTNSWLSQMGVPLFNHPKVDCFWICFSMGNLWFWWVFYGVAIPHQPWSNRTGCPATSGAQYMAVPMRAVRRRCKPGHWRLMAIGPLGHGPGAAIRTTNHGLLILKACDFWIFLVRYV